MPHDTESFNITFLDFDRTIADTFAHPAGIVGVEEAYQIAISDELGHEASVRFEEQGGLLNRAPGELITGLIVEEIPDDAILELTQRLVAAKMNVLTEQISDIWPLPVDGFMPYWSFVEQRAELLSGIVSSGHSPFIKRWFEFRNITPPDVIVSDDELREVQHPTPYPKRVKPSPFGIELAYAEITQRTMESQPHENIAGTRHLNDIMSFAGDDPQKDGKMAEAARLPFFHIDPENPTQGYKQLTDYYQGLMRE